MIFLKQYGFFNKQNLVILSILTIFALRISISYLEIWKFPQHSYDDVAELC